MEVQTLHNPVVLDIPEVVDALAAWTSRDVWIDILRSQMTVGGAVLVVGSVNDTEINGASIVVLPQSFTDVMPWVVHFHNNGGHKLTVLMVKAVLDFIRQAGYTTFKAFNQSGRPDKVWLRIFEDAGTPTFIGSSYLFDLNGATTNGSNSTRKRGARNREQPVRRQRQVQVKNRAKLGSNKRNTAVVQPTRTRARRHAR